MDYKLAKQLKDAGFPQKTQWYWNFDNEEEEWGIWHKWLDESDVANPNLSELIEACGARFRELKQSANGLWTANCWPYKPKLDPNIFYLSKTKSVRGSTPEEAVARLWLELNKK